MDRINSLGWTDGFVVFRDGVRIGVQVNDATLLEPLMKGATVDGWAVEDSEFADILISVRLGNDGRRRGVKNFHLIYLMTTRMFRTLTRDEIPESFLDVLEHARILALNDFLYLQATMMKIGDKVVLALNSRPEDKADVISRSVEASGTVLAEDYVALDGRGRVYAYPSIDNPQKIDKIELYSREPSGAVNPSAIRTNGNAVLALFPFVVRGSENAKKAFHYLSQLCRLAKEFDTLRNPHRI